jgi:hypothetical protein
MGIDKPYAYHKPSDEGLAKITRIARRFRRFSESLITSVP